MSRNRQDRWVRGKDVYLVLPADIHRHLDGRTDGFEFYRDASDYLLERRGGDNPRFLIARVRTKKRAASDGGLKEKTA